MISASKKFKLCALIKFYVKLWYFDEFFSSNSFLKWIICFLIDNLSQDYDVLKGRRLKKNKRRGVIQTVIHACHRFYWSRRLKKLSMGVSHCLAKYFYCEHRLACDRFFRKCEWVCFSKKCNFKCKDVFELLKITRNSSM